MSNPTYYAADAPLRIEGTGEAIPAMARLATGSREGALYEPRRGALYQTTPERYIRDTGSDTLIFAGCSFPNWPRTAISGAPERDFRPAGVRRDAGA
jgi:hypothetical protein